MTDRHLVFKTLREQGLDEDSAYAATEAMNNMAGNNIVEELRATNATARLFRWFVAVIGTLLIGLMAALIATVVALAFQVAELARLVEQSRSAPSAAVIEPVTAAAAPSTGDAAENVLTDDSERSPDSP